MQTARPGTFEFMMLILFEEVQQRAPVLSDLFRYLEWSNYRLGGYLLLNVADDAAWLALIFC